MLKIYHFNQTELFMKLMIDTISNHQLSNPMQSEVVLTENKIMGQWIEIELTKYFGITANITYTNLESFILQISTKFLSDCSITNYICHNSMYWKFMEILPEVCKHKKCSIIDKYLCNDINRKRYSELSDKLTNLFLKYLIYRPDWLKIWQNNKLVNNIDLENQVWQSEIWRIFLENTQLKLEEISPVIRFLYFLQSNNIQKINWSILPCRIFIYGIISIPPIYCKILDLISHHIDIYLWFINPGIDYKNNIMQVNLLGRCQKEYPLYIINQSNVFFKFMNLNKNSNTNLHPLLSKWGHTGLDTLFLLNQYKKSSIKKYFVYFPTNSMLNVIQKNIITFQNTESNKKKSNLFKSRRNRKYILDKSDQSISVHACCNMQREIEVLHDNLLSILSTDPLLSLSDIIVVAPNISDYESTIRSVFNNIFNRKLLFSISSNRNYSITSIISSLLSILNIFESRCTASEILLLLSTPSISSKFNISSEEVQLLQSWTIESGIRWGLDSKTMVKFNFLIDDKNTWYFGLKRMLLGYAIKNKSDLWENISSYDYINEECIKIISRLVDFLEKLKKWRDRLNYSYTVKQWTLYFKEILNDFFNYEKLTLKEQQDLSLFKKYYIDLLYSGVQLNYKNVIHISVLRSKLILKLHQKKMYYRFIPNMINFYDIKPVCYIPCKILCMIGMNNDVYPQNQLEYNFDLMSKSIRCGDIDVQNKDNYIFLLMCLLPKNRIYFSFIDQSIMNSYINKDYPSVLIDELLEYIAGNFYLPKNLHFDIANNIKYIRKFLFHKYSCMPFYSNNFQINSKNQSFANEWLKSAHINTGFNTKICPLYFVSPLPKIKNLTISLYDLYNFYQHPVRTWFQKRLKIYFYQSIYSKLINDEPFSINGICRFQLNSRLLDYLICNKNTDMLYQEVCASGLLPYGSFGELDWMKQYELMNTLANRIKVYYSTEVFNLNISLKFSNIELVGKLCKVQKNGLIRWKSSHLSIKDCFLMWINHLIYCSTGGSGDSRIFGINDMWCFPNFSVFQSKELLFYLIQGYCSGMNKPLMLLYKSGGAWINHIFDWNNRTIHKDIVKHQEARQKLIQVWQGNSRFLSDIRESDDLYLSKIIPYNLKEDDIQVIIDISRKYLLNIMIYRSFL